MRFLCSKFAIIFLFAYPVFTQDICISVPEVSGIWLDLRLGMTVSEVNRSYNNLKIKIKNDKEYRFFQNYIDKKPPPNLAGVRALYLRFFEKKLYQFEIFYEENKYPSDIKSFTEIISSQLNLPVSGWKFSNRQSVFSCREKSLTIDYQLNPRVEMTDEVVVKKLEELRKK